MLRCNEVTRLVATDDIHRAPIGTRLMFRLHLMMCRHCRRYVRELRALGALARRQAAQLVGSDADDAAAEERIMSAVRKAAGSGERG